MMKPIFNYAVAIATLTIAMFSTDCWALPQQESPLQQGINYYNLGNYTETLPYLQQAAVAC
ncbi:MAG: hypothetical protein ACI391_08960 [Muribaculaceae bacterium]